MRDGEGLSSDSIKDTIKISANTQDFNGATLKVGNMHLQHPINHPTRGKTYFKLQLRLPPHQQRLSRRCLLQSWPRPPIMTISSITWKHQFLSWRSKWDKWQAQ